MPPKMILFDLGNVIVRFSHERACEQMAEVAGTNVAVVKKALFEDELQTRYETGMISCEQFHEEFSRQTNTTSELEPLLFAGSNIFWLNASIIPLLGQLRAANQRVGVLSNTCKAHWEFVLERFPVVRKSFSEWVLSYEAKSMKPDGGIYDAAIGLAGCAPEEIFFMDDREDNVAGAVAAGLDAVIYRDTNELYRQLRDRGVEINL